LSNYLKLHDTNIVFNAVIIACATIGSCSSILTLLLMFFPWTTREKDRINKLFTANTFVINSISGLFMLDMIVKKNVKQNVKNRKLYESLDNHCWKRLTSNVFISVGDLCHQYYPTLNQCNFSSA